MIFSKRCCHYCLKLQELKERYYTIARTILEARNPPNRPLTDHPLVKFSYNKAYDIARRQQAEMAFSRARPTDDQLANREAQTKEAEHAQKRAGRIERERQIVETGLQGCVVDVPKTLNLLSESAVQVKGVQKKKTPGAQPETPGPLRRTTTVMRQSVIAELFDTSKAKKISSVAQDFAIDKWIPKAATQRVQDEYFSLGVELLLLSKLRHMVGVRQDAINGLKDKQL
eukprot:c5034_g1_i2.p1 GENE.c5034_g1_i2~~c5034_g1_i2.p1  ORF type:complete len:228 (-),score=50.96 c5034_g1_i2:259-942(-)